MDSRRHPDSSKASKMSWPRASPAPSFRAQISAELIAILAIVIILAIIVAVLTTSNSQGAPDARMGQSQAYWAGQASPLQIINWKLLTATSGTTVESNLSLVIKNPTSQTITIRKLSLSPGHFDNIYRADGTWAGYSDNTYFKLFPGQQATLIAMHYDSSSNAYLPPKYPEFRLNITYDSNLPGSVQSGSFPVILPNILTGSINNPPPDGCPVGQSVCGSTPCCPIDRCINNVCDTDPLPPTCPEGEVYDPDTGACACTDTSCPPSTYCASDGTCQPQSIVYCSNSESANRTKGPGTFDPSANICKDDCPTGQTCTASTCTCAAVNSVSCSNPSDPNRPYVPGEICNSDPKCPDGFICMGDTCTCQSCVSDVNNVCDPVRNPCCPPLVCDSTSGSPTYHLCVSPPGAGACQSFYQYSCLVAGSKSDTMCCPPLSGDPGYDPKQAYVVCDAGLNNGACSCCPAERAIYGGIFTPYFQPGSTYSTSSSCTQCCPANDVACGTGSSQVCCRADACVSSGGGAQTCCDSTVTSGTAVMCGSTGNPSTPVCCAQDNCKTSTADFYRPATAICCPNSGDTAYYKIYNYNLDQSSPGVPVPNGWACCPAGQQVISGNDPYMGEPYAICCPAGVSQAYESADGTYACCAGTVVSVAETSSQPAHEECCTTGNVCNTNQDVILDPTANPISDNALIGECCAHLCNVGTSAYGPVSICCPDANDAVLPYHASWGLPSCCPPSDVVDPISLSKPSLCCSGFSSPVDVCANPVGTDSAGEPYGYTYDQIESYSCCTGSCVPTITDTGSSYPTELCCSINQVVCRPELASQVGEACCSGACISLPSEFTDVTQPKNTAYQKCCPSSDYSVCKSGVGDTTQNWNYLYSCCRNPNVCIGYQSKYYDPSIGQTLDLEKCCSADTTAVGHLGDPKNEPLGCCDSSYPNSADMGGGNILCCPSSSKPAKNPAIPGSPWSCCPTAQYCPTSTAPICCAAGDICQNGACVPQQQCAHTGANSCGGSCPTSAQTCATYDNGNTCGCTCGGASSMCSTFICPGGKTCQVSGNSCACATPPKSCDQSWPSCDGTCSNGHQCHDFGFPSPYMCSCN